MREGIFGCGCRKPRRREKGVPVREPTHQRAVCRRAPDIVLVHVGYNANRISDLADACLVGPSFGFDDEPERKRESGYPRKFAEHVDLVSAASTTNAEA